MILRKSWFQNPGIVSYFSFAGNGLHEKASSAAEPAKAGDAVVVAPKQTGAQGFYKVWVSDAPMEAE